MSKTQCSASTITSYLLLFLLLCISCAQPQLPSDQTVKTFEPLLPDITTQNPTIVQDINAGSKKQDSQGAKQSKDSQSGEKTSTSSPQVVPLMLSGVRVEVTFQSAIIEWDTDEPATSQITYKYICGDCRQFGRPEQYENCLNVCKTNKFRVTLEDTMLLTHHVQIINDFKAIYHLTTPVYNVESGKYDTKDIEQLTQYELKGDYIFSIYSRNESGREIVSGPYFFVWGKEAVYKYDKPISEADIAQSATSWTKRMSSQAVKLINEGEAFFNKYDYTSAFTSYDACIALDPNNSIVWCRKGDALFQQGVTQNSRFIFTKAIDCYVQAIHLDDNNYKAWYGWGNSLNRADPLWDITQILQRARFLENLYRGQY